MAIDGTYYVPYHLPNSTDAFCGAKHSLEYYENHIRPRNNKTEESDNG